VSDIISKLSICEPLTDFEVIDIHGHTGYWFNFNIPDVSPEGLVRSMDQYGIDLSLVSATASISNDFIYGNDLVGELIDRYPDRFRGYIGLNPLYVRETEAEMERCWCAKKGFIGLKLHPEVHCYDFDSPICDQVYQFACKKRCPVLIHVWGKANTLRCLKIAGRFPEMTLLVGHSGGPDSFEEAVEVAKKCPNVYLDLTGSTICEGQLEYFVSEVGSKRVVFGTDQPFVDGRPNLGRVGYARISDEEKKDIYGRNAKAILERIER
jgi:predicted TIM-barrel fold metal-dependent hydrolase